MTIVIKTTDFERICSLANRFGWTPGGIDGTLSRALDFIEEALNVRIEGLDRTTAELKAANAKIAAALVIERYDNEFTIRGAKDALDAARGIGFNDCRAIMRKVLIGDKESK